MSFNNDAIGGQTKSNNSNAIAKTNKITPSISNDSSELTQWINVEVAKKSSMLTTNNHPAERTLKPVLEKNESNATPKSFYNISNSKYTKTSGIPNNSTSNRKITTAEIREKFERAATASAAVAISSGSGHGQTAVGNSSSKEPMSSAIIVSENNNNVLMTAAPTSTSTSSTVAVNAPSSNHKRFSSLDSIVSSSSDTQNLSTQGSTTGFSSFSSLGSNQSLITAQDIQQIVEEADPPLKTPEAYLIVLQRDTPESSIGVTLAGGSDYEAKEITIHKILANTPAAKDGRLKKGDRILAVNGKSMRGLTHRESISVLKTPRLEVVFLVTRSESITIKPLAKKRASLGSLTSLIEKSTEVEQQQQVKKRNNYHEQSRSLDLDLDIVTNDKTENGLKAKPRPTATAERQQRDRDVLDTTSKIVSNSHNKTKVTTTPVIATAATPSTENYVRWQYSRSEANKLSTSQLLERAAETRQALATEIKMQEGISTSSSSSNSAASASAAITKGAAKIIEIIKDNCGLGFSIEGGFDSPTGDRPLIVKKVFLGGAAHKTGQIKSGDEILNINGASTSRMTRVDAWNYMKQLPLGPVKIVFA